MCARSAGDGRINKKKPRALNTQGAKPPFAHTSKAKTSAHRINKASRPTTPYRKRLATPGHILPSQTVVPFTGKSVTGGEPLSIRIASHGNNIIQFDPGIYPNQHSNWTSELEVVQVGQDWLGVELTHSHEFKEPLSLFWQRVWSHFLINDESRQRVLRDFIHFAIEIEKNKSSISKQELDYWIHMIQEEALALIEVISNDSAYLSQDPHKRTDLLKILKHLEQSNFHIDSSQLLSLGPIIELECETTAALQKIFHTRDYLKLIELTKSYRINGSDWMEIEAQWFSYYLTTPEDKDFKLKHYLIFLAEGYQRGYCIEDNCLLDRMHYIIHELKPSAETLILVQEPLKFLAQVLFLRKATWQEKDLWYSTLLKLYNYSLSITGTQ